MMKVTDDLYSKEVLLSGAQLEVNGPNEAAAVDGERAFYRKLQAYLLLLYQSYLKKETTLEAEVRMAIWRMMRFDKEFSLKIQMAQQFYLKVDVTDLTGDWDEVKQQLFPFESAETEERVSAKTKKQVESYKEVVSELLQSQY